ncbi:hypothetical protein [Streptomyces sp. I05A-00742]|uniref:hypothetical protein n=1 Tax=Streptomyces sp. I05A-00742 TaxID=2732853 RepID=UPI0014889CC0|nr:hypothetical protein [Streptomyces sp. I05A-00742]
MTTPQPPQQPYGYPQQPQPPQGAAPPPGPYASGAPTGPYAAPQQAPQQAAPQPGPYAQQQPGAYAAPPQPNPYAAPPQGNPYGAPQGNPYGAGQGQPQGNPYGTPEGGPYAAPPQSDPYAGAPQPTPQPGAHGNCEICGGFPAAQMTVRRHQGLVLMMRFFSRPGRFCRTCATALHRDMTAKTCWQWWSPFSLIIFTPLTLFWNLAVHAKIRKLAPPAPGSHGPQLDPGAPLFKRPGAIGLIVPVGWYVALAVQILLHM